MKMMWIEDAFVARGCLVITGRLLNPVVKGVQDVRNLLAGEGLVVVAADGSEFVAELYDVVVSWRSDVELQVSIALAFAVNWSMELTESTARTFVGGLLLKNDV